MSPALGRAAGETAARVPPLFWYESDPETRRRFVMALLLYWSGRDPEGSFDLLAPFYYHERTPEEQLDLLLPLHFRYKTKDAESNLWGPYFFRKSLQAQTRFLIPFYFDQRSQGNRLTLYPLFLSYETPAARSQLLPPLYWAYRPRDPKAQAYQVVFPFYFRKWNSERNLFISPLFWSARDPALSQGFAIPYFWRHTPTGKTEVGFPLYWRFQRKKEDYTRDVQVAVPYFRVSGKSTEIRSFVPIYWGVDRDYREQETSSGTLRRSHFNLLLPLYYGYDRPDGLRKRLTPLFSRFRDADGKEFGHYGPAFFVNYPWGGKIRGLFPLFYRRGEPDFSRFRFLFFYDERSRDGLHARTSLFPLLSFQRDADRAQILTPVFYRDRDAERDRGFFLAYFWKTERQMDDPARAVVLRKRFLAPLFWDYASEDRKIWVAAPLAAFYRRPDYRFSWVAPFYFHRVKGDDSFTLVPPLMARSSPGRRWLGLFFLYWQNARADRSSITLLPLFRRSRFPGGTSLFLPGYYHLTAQDGTQGVVGPYLWDHRGATQYEIFPPLYVRFQRPTWKLWAVFPYYRFRNGELDEKGIFPIWAATKPAPSTTTAVPETSTQTLSGYLVNSHRVLPFYFYRKTSNGSDLILPLILGRIEKERDAQGGRSVRGRYLLAGYWESTPKSFVSRFDPLYAYGRGPDRKGFTVPTAPFPLWSYGVENLQSPDQRVEHGSVFPYYWRDSRAYSRRFFLPLYYASRHRTQEGKETSRLTWLLAYFASQNKTEAKSKRIVAPFYWRFSDRQETRTFNLVPPLWMERGADVNRTVAFPLWGSFRHGQEKTRVFFPLYFRNDDPAARSSVTLLPGYWRRQSAEGDSLLVVNYFRRESRDGSEKTSLLFPLYWASRSPGRQERTVFPFYWTWQEEGRSVDYLFPLYFHHRREHLDWSVVFPLAWRFTTDDAVTRVVPPYFSVRSLKSAERVTGFAPLWTYARNPQEDWKAFQVLGGLFGYERSRRERRVTLFYLLKI